MSDPSSLPAPLSLDDFAVFYQALYGVRSFEWQKRLARQACIGQWPEYVKLPTSSGKTAAIDIAVFALAYQAAESNRSDGAMTAPRRIFFVVDRRIIVNEAYQRAERAARLLRKTIDPETELNSADDAFYGSLDDSRRDILNRAARWLHHLAGSTSAPPLDCFELRGGIYRDDAWVRSPLQPTVLTSTVDQVGSRLLFRGYGVSDRNLSIHAALTSNDSLVILDEAHCSKPFSQTLEAIQFYRGAKWAREAVETPFRFVQMTATPPDDLDSSKVFELTGADYDSDSPLELRHGCSKPISLFMANNAEGKKRNEILAKKLAEQAELLASKHGLRKIAIVVNRVDIARKAFALFQEKHGKRAFLMIGRMRPLDRDKLTRELQSKFGSGRTDAANHADDVESQFVVATQCLEVGADLDFDGMVSQCASLEALRQRFGRLNRLGGSPQARGVIVAAEGDVIPLDKLDDAKPIDPIYDNALARTWHWLNERATATNESDNGEQIRVIDFGVKAMDALCSSAANDVNMQGLTAPAPNAPVLMPAHIDILCQTSPRPTPEPDVAAYLHGANRGLPEVRVCWRADLDLSRLDNAANWIAAVGLCPPSSAECLVVPLNVFRRWLCGESVVDDTGDVLGEAIEPTEPDEKKVDSRRTVLVWHGKDRENKKRRNQEDALRYSFLATAGNARRIGPNDTVVIPAEFGGWKAFGYIPDAPPDPSIDAKKFPTTEPCELHKLLMKRSVDLLEPTDSDAEALMNDQKPAIRRLAEIDVADQAFLQSRARTIWRIHPKLYCESELRNLQSELLAASSDKDANLGIKRWRDRAIELRQAPGITEESPVDVRDGHLLFRLTEWGESIGGTIFRYCDGLMWITERHPSLRPGMLPLPSFGDDEDSLSLTGDNDDSLVFNGKVPLLQHLADVVHEADRLTSTLQINSRLSNTILAAAKFHDVGKADVRFQAMLIGKPISTAHMQPQLWAKSEGGIRNSPSELPDAFRHEMLSLSLLGAFERNHEDVDDELLQHEIASHHGHARPLAPVCIDQSPPGVNLRSLSCGAISAEDRRQWMPAHRLDSGVAERFWLLNRRYGWWGLAHLESLLRLADWAASANSGSGKQQPTFIAKQRDPVRGKSQPKPQSLPLSGIDGSNPLGFLATLGAFRILSESIREGDLRIHWQLFDGAWRPIFSCGEGFELVEEGVLDRLEGELRMAPEAHAAIRLPESLDAHGSYRSLFLSSSRTASLKARGDADWLSCNGSDAVNPDAISQLQTTRRDYHAINIRGLLTTTTQEHLRRTLFRAWDYADPIAGVSLHLEPREDRRHAYQWHMPSGDPTRSSCGGMIGANRLALEAWPLFQSLPDGDKMITVGFQGTRANNTTFTWPIWSAPINLETLRSVLSLARLRDRDADVRELAASGISVVYRCRRILVGKTPNLTSSVAALV